MPTSDERPLGERLVVASERLLACMQYETMGDWGEEIADLEEAAAYIAARERAEAQPEVAKLRELADAFLVVQDHYTVQPAELSGFFNAHAAALVALAEAERQVDAVNGLAEKFRKRARSRCERAEIGYPAHDSNRESGIAGTLQSCAAGLTAALASPGPSLRERVEAAVRDLHSRAQYLGEQTDGEAATPAAIEACCARIEAALRGESE